MGRGDSVVQPHGMGGVRGERRDTHRNTHTHTEEHRRECCTCTLATCPLKSAQHPARKGRHKVQGSVDPMFLPEKKSLNGFRSRRSVFSNLLAVWDVSVAGITESEAEDLVEAKVRN